MSQSTDETPLLHGRRGWRRWVCYAPPPGADDELTWAQNLLYGCAAAFSVANLYYNHPILNVLAVDFNVSDERASLVPTVMQAGYAVGLFFVIPIGDLVRRRPFVLALIFITSCLWLGLAITRSFSVFLGLSFLVAVLTVTPQLMFPLVVQYAPQRHRAVMVSIVMSGVVFGVLIARLLSGIIAQYTSWRNVYWTSYGLQLFIFGLLFLLMPDYPILRPDSSYAKILLLVLRLPFRHPILLQCSLIAFFTMGMFTLFWTTLTFQLAGPPFNLSTLVIGLFALIGISPVFLNPIVSWLIISRIHPIGTLVFAILIALSAVVVGTFVGTFSLAGPVIWAFFGDLGMNTIQVGNRMAFASVEPSAQNTVNSVYMLLTFFGQLFGIAVGNKLYAQGGWRYSGYLAIAMMGAALLTCISRGPHEKGWVGWGGGWHLGKTKVEAELQTPSVGDVEANSAPLPASEKKPNETSPGSRSDVNTSATKS